VTAPAAEIPVPPIAAAAVMAGLTVPSPPARTGP